MTKPRSSGVCQLTGSFGPFVDSHIIPLALTRLSRTGEKHIEAGIGLGVKSRANSWYDRSLVTRAGEDILASIDSKGIEELRRHRLVWTGWESGERLLTDDLVQHAGRPAFRFLRIARPEVLQLFLVSLLWRAGASTRPEFKEIAFAADVLEDLRQRVLKQDPGSFADYPVQLFQIITRGVTHNRTPLLETKHTLNGDGSRGPRVPYVRLYFDGLVAHAHLGRGYQLPPDYLNTCLGLAETTPVFVHEFAQSRTAGDIKEMVEVVERERMTIASALNSATVAIRIGWPPTSS